MADLAQRYEDAKRDFKRWNKLGPNRKRALAAEAELDGVVREMAIHVIVHSLDDLYPEDKDGSERSYADQVVADELGLTGTDGGEDDK
jgi:hypothetical protein